MPIEHTSEPGGPPIAFPPVVNPAPDDHQDALKSFPPWAGLSGSLVLPIAFAVVGYLCWLLLSPFLPALAFAFALAMLGAPLYRWLSRKLPGENTAAFLSVVIISLIFVIPVIFLAQILVREAMQAVSAVSDPKYVANIRATLEHSKFFGPLMAWLDAQLDLPAETAQAAQVAMQWLSKWSSSIVSGSAWAITQLGTMFVVLFYFLRDQQTILAHLRSLVPLGKEETDQLFTKITETIRISLYGKVVVAAIQGGLGGLIFWWLGLPAPAFWGFVMALLSVLPVLGAFVIWVPAAVVLAMADHWTKALVLTGWGFLIVHPVDNFLGPVLVGTRLHLHTLLTFFSVIGGLAAFGASGLVLGPVTMAVAVSLYEIRERRMGRASTGANP